MKWFRGRDKDKADLTEVEEVIAEAGRLLSGRAFDAQRVYRRRGWALVGALAHGDRAGYKSSRAPNLQSPG